MSYKKKNKTYRASEEWERRMREKVCIPNGISLPKATLYSIQTKAFADMEKEIKRIVEEKKRAKRK